MDRTLNLPDVTLIAASSIALDATLTALRQSMRNISFAKAILFSDRLPQNADMTGIEWHQIEPLTSREAYSHFMLCDLHQYIQTSHVLCVQWDGYVLNPQAWQDSFLAHDYIGAPWPHMGDQYTVGNGGFSIRSHRLLAVSATLDFDVQLAEDVILCRTKRAELEQMHNLRFAPESLARQFSFERYPSQGGEFGFHGVSNLVKLLPYKSVLRLMSDLEATALAQSEHKELLQWAVYHYHFRLISVLLMRMLKRWSVSLLKASDRARHIDKQLYVH